jgi:peptidoglycan-associated lipoprotein
MEEIPVKHKTPVVVPIWAWILGALAVLGIIGAVVGMKSCGTTKTVETTTVTTIGGQCTGDGECGEKQLCVSAACIDIKAGLAECANAEVHFATDSAVIGDDHKQGIMRMARCLKADQTMKLSIAGNADERGKAEHNAELGEKRAMAVARTLQAQGVSAKQLSIVNYGENYPLCVESDQECWAKNRRTTLTPKAEPAAK